MFKNITLKNFLSWKDLTFEFNNGITLLSGFNYDDLTEEGTGKSSIPNALCWCLFGKIPKNIKIDEVISKGENTCFVTVELTNGSKIYRSRKPNQLVLQKYKDGEYTFIEGSDSKATQELIEQYIGFSYEVFCQAIYFAQNYDKDFISATPEEKNKILSDLIDTADYDKAREYCKNQFNELEKKVVVLDLNKENYKKIIESLSTTITNLTLLLDSTKNKDFKKEIEELSNKSKTLSEEISKYPIGVLQKRLKELDERFLDQRNVKDNLEKKLMQLEIDTNTINNLEKTKDSIIKESNTLKEKLYKSVRKPKNLCPLCQEPLKAINANLVELEIKDISSEIEKKENKVKEINHKISEFLLPVPDKFKEEIKNIKLRMEVLQKEYNQLNQQLVYITDQKHIVTYTESLLKNKIDEKNRHLSIIIKLEEEIKLNTHAKQEKKDEISKIEQEKINLFQDLKQYDVLKDAFKEVKIYNFKHILEVLSEKTNNYLQELFNVSVELNFFNKVDVNGPGKVDYIITYNGQPRSLGLFSGGQLKRIQIAVNLALSDIVSLRTANNINLLILDEICSNLSETSKEKLLKLLERQEKKIIMIEHSETFKPIFTNNFKIAYRNGESKIEEYAS